MKTVFGLLVMQASGLASGLYPAEGHAFCLRTEKGKFSFLWLICRLMPSNYTYLFI